MDGVSAGQTAAAAATTHSTLFGKARRAACGCRTVLISAADQDNCRADCRAEKEGSFHLIVGSLFGSGPDARFPLPPIMNLEKSKP
jgi:hypothetical protein